MQKIELKKIEHNIKIGDVCPDHQPNVIEDSYLCSDGKPIGFYISNISKYSETISKLADIANAELLSDRVPKTKMGRSTGAYDGHNVLQLSTIIGGCPPRPHMKRPYPTMSSVHAVRSAELFVKAMKRLCFESEELIKKLTPDIFERQVKIFKEKVPEKWRFGRMFTSSISNYNISAPFHRDAANIPDTVNVIITKKWRASGGNLHVPDYGATIDSKENSILVYPAWRNVHGVTPIHVTAAGGYRNSLVFYPLRAFMEKN